MGLHRDVAEMILREHHYRPITGDVLLIGRQTMFFSPEVAIEVAERNGVRRRSVELADLEIDSETLQSGTGRCVRDRSFFDLFTDARVRALDHSDYEGAEIIHDLNKPLPDSLEGIADFIVDGSTLDNVFDPALALRNLTRLLKPGGRLFSINAGSLHGGAYTVVTPHWLLDYFVVNQFADAHVYAVTFDGEGIREAFTIDLDSIARREWPDNFRAHLAVGLVVLAEKGRFSTWGASPAQQIYRAEAHWSEYLPTLNRMRRSERPYLVFTAQRSETTTAQPGYLLIPQP